MGRIITPLEAKSTTIFHSEEEAGFKAFPASTLRLLAAERSASGLLLLYLEM
jgi:hypothetical protein